MLTIKMAADLTSELILRNWLHTADEACKWGDYPAGVD